MPEHWETRQAREHWERYDKIAKWLGWNNVRKLVPFSNEGVKLALANGDKHLNSLQLAAWDRQHGNTPGKKLDAPKVCQCCKQTLPPPDQTAGMWGLVRAAIKRDKLAGREPLLTSWSLSDTVSTLKHVAREVANA